MPSSSQEMRQVAIDNANVLFFPASAPAMGLVFVPALGVPADYYADFARALNQRGISVAVNELRGHRRVDFGYSTLINKDLKAVVHLAARAFSGLPLILGGHSLGGQLVALYAGRYQPQVEGILQIACSSPYYRGFPPSRARTIYWGSYLIQAVSGVLGYFPGRVFGFGGREARRLMNDWARIARYNLFNFDGDPFDYDGTLAAIGSPVLNLCFPADTYAPLSAVHRFTDKLPQNQLHIEMLDTPEFHQTHHFNWVRQGDLLAPVLLRWLARIAA